MRYRIELVNEWDFNINVKKGRIQKESQLWFCGLANQLFCVTIWLHNQLQKDLFNKFQIEFWLKDNF